MLSPHWPPKVIPLRYNVCGVWYDVCMMCGMCTMCECMMCVCDICVCGMCGVECVCDVYNMCVVCV